MKLKTFTAPTMADALAAVRKDFGPDAMILHTRSYRVGSWFGLGGKNMVEITASAGEPSAKPRKHARRDRLPPEFDDDRAAVLTGGSTPTRNAPARPAPRDSAEVVVQRASSVVEPKPVLTRRPEPAASASPRAHPSQPPEPEPARSRPDPMARTPIATRLHRDDARPPVRIADATPPPPPGDGNARPPADRSRDLPDRPADRHTDRPGPDAEVREPKVAAPRPPEPLTPEPRAEDPAELRGQIAELQKMMGQVLESTRRTSVAMGKVDPRAAESVEPGPLLDAINKLLDNDAPMDTVDRIMARVRDRLDSTELRDTLVVRQAVLREIEASIETRSDSLLALSASTATGRPRVIALVGPTGVGKTTTVAKLAATCKLRHGRRVGLITSDTYRIAAVEQLRTYAGIIGLPLKVANTPDEMAQAIDGFASMDVIIVDTAGRSQHDARRLDELKAFIAAAAPDETHLVLASTVGDTVMRRTAERFKPLGPDRCILTKLDEAVCTGPIAGLTGRIGLPLSFVTVGQEVPDDIEPARADRLARLALDGPGVLGRGSDGRD
ncbi:MAG: flagellar biosynthesis protein FlhF [Phycisphaerales bacterium]|nr:flagellar biosynthesis protein FlhF [Planctomycetota bacterium]MCH8508519.1 flagellar biosynthesis protein FlhF [Phycisphaerales bacterium]